MNDGAVTATPFVQSLGFGQLNCRRLWGRDGSVHDGFIALTSSACRFYVCRKLHLSL